MSTHNLRIHPGPLQAARLTPPLSKSDAQRRLVLEHLLGMDPSAGMDGRSARDVRVLARALESLRAPAVEPRLVDCADGGAPFRLFVGQAAVTPGAHVAITGSARLGERPHRPLLDALVETLGQAGLHLHEGTPWPLLVRAGEGRATEPCFRISGKESSQFASSLLLAAATLARREQRAWRVELVGALTSEGYLALTVDWMRRAGLTVERDGSTFTVHPAPASVPALPAVPGDWSSLGYLLVLAWRSGGEVSDVDLRAAHPDRAIARVLGEVGLSLQVDGAGVARVLGTPTRGLEADGAECPDLLPTLAVLACALPGRSHLRTVHVLRAKESDRLEGIRSLVTQAGGELTDAGEDALVITPPSQVPSEELYVESQDDHRLAMSGALLAVLQGRRAVITEPECVAKSFPGFWEELSRVGVTLER